MPAPNYAVPPVRPGADPVLDVNQAGLTAKPTLQPAYLKVTDALTAWMRWHFGAASRIEFPDLVGRLWNGTPEASTIWIGSLATWNPQKSGERPALLVDRLEQQLDLSKRGINDQLQGGPPFSFYCYMTGQHVVHCLGGREGEAELLAAEVWRELRRYAHVARDALCLVRFLPVSPGKRTQLSDEHKAVYTVPVVVQYGYAESWQAVPRDEAEIRQIITVPPAS